MQKRLSARQIETVRRVKREYPETTKQQLAARFGVSARTIQRYWVAEGGEASPEVYDPYLPPPSLGAAWPF